MKDERPFLYGAATSSHQVEGNNIHNDWWQWEKRTSGIQESGKAADHWGQYKEDFALAKQLGHNAHRFSLEWSRIEPRQGHINKKAINHYRDVLIELRRLGLKSFVTLHHFTNPVWFSNKGGWAHPDAPELFDRYVKVVGQHFSELVDFWVTINEPMVYATQSYWRSQWPPAQKNMWQMLRVVRHMAAAHRRVYRTLHSISPGVPVGFAKHLVAYVPEHITQLDDQIVSRFEDYWFNHRFFNQVRGDFDFVGVNYYFARKFRVHLLPPTLKLLPWSGPVTDLDWPIAPHGLVHVLDHMRRYKRPIYITENGLADADDSKRADFIRDHLRAVEQAQAAGADVRGYLHWSLLDNFEWAAGFAPRFGLIEVDYKTMERTIRPSAYVYKAIIEQANNS